jgi:hypothetical protein
VYLKDVDAVFNAVILVCVGLSGYKCRMVMWAYVSMECIYIYIYIYIYRAGITGALGFGY